MNRAESFTRQILVADEGTDGCDIMVQALAYLGYTAVCVTNVAEAVRLIEERGFVGIVTELVLPGGSGFDVLEAARRSTHNLHAPVIALSGHHEYRHRVTQAGFTAFVPKPVEVLKLRQVLTQLIPLTP